MNLQGPFVLEYCLLYILNSIIRQIKHRLICLYFKSVISKMGYIWQLIRGVGTKY